MKFQQVQNTNTDQRSASTKHPPKSTPNNHLKSRLKKKTPKTHQIIFKSKRERPGSRAATWVACCDLGRVAAPKPALLLEGLMFRPDLVVQGLMFLEGDSCSNSSTKKCFAGQEMFCWVRKCEMMKIIIRNGTHQTHAETLYKSSLKDSISRWSPRGKNVTLDMINP